MAVTGGCYCGALRYEVEGAPLFKGQCHCRECQHISGGGANLFVTMPADGFRFVKGTPKGFSRDDLEEAVTREFCEVCGTHISTRSPRYTGTVILKIGTLDDPAHFGGPQAAIWISEAQAFHVIPEELRKFPGFPGAR